MLWQTPEHIKQIATLCRALARPVDRRVFVPEDKPRCPSGPKAERSRIARKICEGEFVTRLRSFRPKDASVKMLEGVRV